MMTAPGAQPRFVERRGQAEAGRSRAGQGERLADVQMPFLGDCPGEDQPAPGT